MLRSKDLERSARLGPENGLQVSEVNKCFSTSRNTRKLSVYSKESVEKNAPTIQTKRMFITALPRVIKTFWLNGSCRHFDGRRIVMETVASNIACRAPVRSEQLARTSFFFFEERKSKPREALSLINAEQDVQVNDKKKEILSVSNLRSSTPAEIETPVDGSIERIGRHLKRRPSLQHCARI